MRWMTVVETPEFLRIAEKYVGRDVLDSMIEHISNNPEAGDIIPNTGGCRKIRWQKKANEGKSGGVRTIYYFYDENMPVYLLVTYPKNVKANIDSDIENALKTMVKGLVKRHKESIGG